MLRNLHLDTDKILETESVWDGTKKLAAEISTDANNATQAPAGFTYNDLGSGRDRVIRLGARGAAAYPVEFGHQGVAAKRPMKKTLSRYRE